MPKICCNMMPTYVEICWIVMPKICRNILECNATLCKNISNMQNNDALMLLNTQTYASSNIEIYWNITKYVNICLNVMEIKRSAWKTISNQGRTIKAIVKSSSFVSKPTKFTDSRQDPLIKNHQENSNTQVLDMRWDPLPLPAAVSPKVVRVTGDPLARAGPPYVELPKTKGIARRWRG